MLISISSIRHIHASAGGGAPPSFRRVLGELKTFSFHPSHSPGGERQGRALLLYGCLALGEPVPTCTSLRASTLAQPRVLAPLLGGVRRRAETKKPQPFEGCQWPDAPSITRAEPQRPDSLSGEPESEQRTHSGGAGGGWEHTPPVVEPRADTCGRLAVLGARRILCGLEHGG